jgi:hypothetical protein
VITGPIATGVGLGVAVGVSAGVGVDVGVPEWVIVGDTVAVPVGGGVALGIVDVAVAVAATLWLAGAVAVAVPAAVALWPVGAVAVAVATALATAVPVALMIGVRVGLGGGVVGAVVGGVAGAIDRVAEAVAVGAPVTAVVDTTGVTVGDAPGQPASALLTAPISSNSCTAASPLVSSAAHVSTPSSPSAICTPRMSSLTATAPSPSQSPRQPAMPPAGADAVARTTTSAATLITNADHFWHRPANFGAIAMTKSHQRDGGNHRSAANVVDAPRSVFRVSRSACQKRAPRMTRNAQRETRSTEPVYPRPTSTCRNGTKRSTKLPWNCRKVTENVPRQAVSSM